MSLDGALLRVGAVIAALLLGRFAIDFGRWMPIWLAVPSWVLVAATIVVAGRNAFRRERSSPPALAPWARLVLVATVPLAFVGSSLDCMGLSLGGCTTTCALLKSVWFPALLVACGFAAITAKGSALTAVIALSFVPLIPHCVCRNPVNAWWMDRLGTSPMCLSWGFVASVVALGALVQRSHVRAALGVSGAITAGTLGFFLGHHYFHFPW